MATIAKMAINLGWNGQQAEAGLDRVGKKTEQTTEKIKQSSKEVEKSTSVFGRLAKVLKGANDVKSTFEMVRGVSMFATAIPQALLGLGSELETMQIKVGALVGGFDKGVASLNVMRQIARDMGVPLTDLVKGFSELVGAGVGAGDAETLLRTFANIAPLLGDGGLGQLSTSIAAMVKTGVAQADALNQMQNGGLPVYQALADKLTRITGEFHSIKDAQAAVERGAVLASTAIGAMQEAARSPQALEAAQRIANSIEGQLARLQQNFIELFRDLGTMLIRGLDLDSLLASIRGVASGLGEIASTFLNSFATVAGPNGHADRLEKSFKSGRDLAFDLAEGLIDGVTKVAELFGGIEATMMRISAHTRWWKDAYKATKQSEMEVADALFKHSMDQAQKVADAAGIKEAGDRAKALIRAARAGAGWNDMQRQGDMKAGGAPVQVVVPMQQPAMLDSFSALRDLQTKMAQGMRFGGTGQVSGAFASILQAGQSDPNAWMAGRLEAGTTAAMDAIMQHQYGNEAKSLQQQIADGIKATEDLNKKQVQNEEEMIKILKTLRLPTARV